MGSRVRHDRISVAVQCNGEIHGSMKRCKRWNLIQTENVNGAIATCKSCGKSLKLKGSFGWNLNTELPKAGETGSELIQRLNSEEKM